MSELRKCPFCGSEAKIDGIDGEKKWINCSNDNCDLSVDWILIEEWNTRPLEDALIAECDLLRQQLDVAMKAIKDIRAGYWVEHVHYSATWWTEKQCDEALAEIAKLGEKK